MEGIDSEMENTLAEESASRSRYNVYRYRLIPTRRIVRKQVVVCKKAPPRCSLLAEANEEVSEVAQVDCSQTRRVWRVRSLSCTYGFQSFYYYTYAW